MDSRLAGVAAVPCAGGAGWFVLMFDEDIAYLEDEIARAAIADAGLVRSAQAVEHRQAGAIKRYAQARRCLPGMGMCNQQIAADRSVFKVFQVADAHLGTGQPGEHR